MTLALYIAAGLFGIFALIGFALMFGSPREPDDGQDDPPDDPNFWRMP